MAIFITLWNLGAPRQMSTLPMGKDASGGCTHPISFLYRLRELPLSKALRKTEFSEFCTFAKFGTCFGPYFLKIRSLLHQNRISRNTKLLENIRF
jgi:hypothetical protein